MAVVVVAVVVRVAMMVVVIMVVSFHLHQGREGRRAIAGDDGAEATDNLVHQIVGIFELREFRVPERGKKKKTKGQEIKGNDKNRKLK
jgi:hypothetical protein